ncbi:DUF58 domain-containing protein [Rubritalea spongiae]|uniref:DUF58 domain-containing protein n=1 Tax=Rubritalea spongiae TaxID=430797 RepID=A0ABW5DXQ7_9BACT
MNQTIQRRLYKLYSSSSRSSFGLRNRISSLGWIVVCGLPLCAFMASMYPRDTFFQLLGVVSAVCIAAFVSVLLRKAQLKVRRLLPRHASVGRPLEYTVEYTNLAKRGLNNFYMLDLAPDPTPSMDVFLHATEPGEEKRNAFDRFFLAYRWNWLKSRFLLMKSKLFLANSVGGEKCGKVRVELLPLRRGVIHLQNMRVVLPDALGLFQRVKRVDQEEDILIVLPKRYRMDSFDFAGQARSQVGGDSSTSTQGQSGEFVSLREYRPGDPPKHIHWPSWGRTGKPILKEYEEMFFPRYGLVLDTAVRAEQEEVFEELVSVAATLTSEMDTDQSLIDVMFIQQGAKVQTVGKNVERVEAMLELLASVEIDPVADWAALKNAVLKHADDLTTCFLVFGDWDDERENFLQSLSSFGISLVVLVVQDEENPVKLNSDYTEITLLNVGEIEQGLASIHL